MKLTHSCLLTRDVKRLKEFYQEVLGVEGQEYGSDYVEFATLKGVLAIYDLEAHLELAPDTANLEGKQNIILEFEVEDVDQEYRRLKDSKVEIVKSLTTQEWGNRSFYFRDPDGNLINFYSHLSK